MALKLNGTLDFEARQLFVAEAHSEIQSSNSVTLDCSEVGTIDDGTIGMMVTIARSAARRGGRVQLVKVPQRLVDELQAANVSHSFDWKSGRPGSSR
jgi:anti-anti-sigma regulatory factor